MRLFIFVLLFTIFYSCSSENQNLTTEPEKDLPYRIEWLNNQHVKVEFDTLTGSKIKFLDWALLKSAEIKNDSVYYEVFAYDIKIKERSWQTKVFKTNILENNKKIVDSLIISPQDVVFYPLSQLENYPASAKKVKNTIIADSLTINGGGMGIPLTDFTLKKDSIFISRKGYKTVALFLKNANISIPDTIQFKGQASTSLLAKINVAVNLVDLKEFNKNEASPIGYGSHSPGFHLSLYQNGKRYSYNAIGFTYGISKLLNIVLNLTEEDLE